MSNHLEVREIEISKIKVGKRAREDKGDLQELAASIHDKGLLQPITVNQYMELLAGERRLLASQLAGLKSIPAVVRESDKLDAKEIELIENIQRKDFSWQERARLEKEIWDYKSDRENWSQRKQAEMLNSAQSQVNRRLQLAEAMEYLPDLAEHETEDEAWKELKKLEETAAIKHLESKVAPEVKKAASSADRHYIIGNALERMPKLHPTTAHFAEVDPPYAIELIEARSQRRKDISLGESYEEVAAEDYMPFYEKVAREVHRVLIDHSFAVFWYGITWHNEVRELLRSVGFGVPDVPAIWYKGNIGQTASPDTTLGNSYETFFLARKGQPKLRKPGRSNVFAYAPVSPTQKVHRTEKPLDLMLDILTTILNPGSRMIIPFLGSGVTLRSAYLLGHTGFGYDLSEKHKEGFLQKVASDQEAMGESPEEPRT